MSQYAIITDIEWTNEYEQDFLYASEQAQKKMVNLCDMITESHHFPPSMNVREAFRDDLWMGTVTQNRLAWRVLFWIEGSTVIFHRLLTHDQRDAYLRI